MIKIVNLSLQTKSIPTRFDFVQYSTSPKIAFRVTDMDITSSMTAKVYAEKPSGLEVYSNLTYADKMFVLTPTTQMFAEVGITKMQLQITDSGGLAHSFKIYADVEENIIDSEAVESQDEFTALQEAIAQLGQYDGRLQSLEDHTVKDNENGNIDGRLAVTGLLSSDTGINSYGSYIGIRNTGSTTNEYETLYFGNQANNTVAFIRCYDGDANGSAMLIRPAGPLILGGGEYAINRYLLGDISPTSNESTYIGSDGSIFFETGGNTIENRKTWTLNTSGNWISEGVGQGIYGMDGTEFQYPYIRDNGTNLWMGSRDASSTSHTGKTYISSGYDSETQTGNKSILVAIPNADNSASTARYVFHEGYLDVSRATDGILPRAYGGTGIPDYCTNEAGGWNGGTQIADKSISSGTSYQNLGSFDLRKGVYILIVGSRFTANGEGYRKLCVSTTSTGGSLANLFEEAKNALTGAVTPVSLCRIYRTASDVTLYVNAMQNSGSALTVTTRIQALRIGEV